MDEIKKNTDAAHGAADRGECRELDADTMKRCTGRMVVYYETLHGQIGFPVWRCDSCGKVMVP